MTAQCRLILVSSLALMLSACLHLDDASKPVVSETKTEPPPKPIAILSKTQFAELVSRPGMVVPLHPDAAAKESPVVEPATPSNVVPAATDPVEPAHGPFFSAQSLPEPPLLMAVRAYAEGHPDRAIEYLVTLGKPNQDFVMTVLPLLWQGATTDLAADPHAAAVLAEQLRGAAARIEPAAALKLEAASLCREVNGYGLYDPWPKGQPYRPNDLAMLYLEVRNLVCQPAAGPKGETYLIRYQATTQIRDAYGKLVDQLNPKDYHGLVPVGQVEKKRYTRTPVHDFYVLCYFQAPTTPGVYTLSVEIKDLVTQRTVNTRPIEFTVAGP